MDDVEKHGLEIKRFDGGWKAHITLGWTKEKGVEGSYPIEFHSGSAYVSVPRPLRRTAEAFSQGFGHWWNNEKPHGINDAKKMAEYAAGTKTSRKEAVAFIERHREDVHGDFDEFKERFLKKFDRLRKSSAAPRETIMQRLHREMQLPTTEIWKLGEGVANGNATGDSGEQHLRDQMWPIGEGVSAAP
jgi:hypothetical protein